MPGEAITFGRYRILRRIARGSMSEVLLALDREPDGSVRVVVLKRIPAGAVDEEVARLFLEEASRALRLSHPNVSRTLQVGTAEGCPFLATEYLVGEDLASLIQQCKRAGKVVPVPLALEIMLGVVHALRHAHELAADDKGPAGVLHRQLAPSNVVVTYDGQVKVVDFGIGRAEQEHLRRTGQPGKILYLAPEQAAGEAGDARSELFSAGVVLHELLTTERLFKRETERDTLAAVVAADVPSPSERRPDVPRALDELCTRVLARDPAARYQRAGDLAAALAGTLTGLGGRPGPGPLGALVCELFPEDRRQRKSRVIEQATRADWDRHLVVAQNLDGFTPIRTAVSVVRAGLGPPIQARPPTRPGAAPAAAGPREAPPAAAGPHEAPPPSFGGGTTGTNPVAGKLLASPRATPAGPATAASRAARWEAAVGVLLVLVGFVLGTVFGSFVGARRVEAATVARPADLPTARAP